MFPTVLVTLLSLAATSFAAPAASPPNWIANASSDLGDKTEIKFSPGVLSGALADLCMFGNRHDGTVSTNKDDYKGHVFTQTENAYKKPNGDDVSGYTAEIPTADGGHVTFLVQNIGKYDSNQCFEVVFGVWNDIFIKDNYETLTMRPIHTHGNFDNGAWSYTLF